MLEINIGEITEALNNKLDLDLGNIDDSESKLDGEWVYPETIASLVAEMSMNSGTDLELDLVSVLPQDNNIYECILSAGCLTGTTNGNYINIAVRTSAMPSDKYLNICGCQTRSSSAVATVGSTTTTIGADRKLFVRRTTNFNGNLQYMYVIAYRKVR